jgi:hypothetical protein
MISQAHENLKMLEEQEQTASVKRSIENNKQRIRNAEVKVAFPQWTIRFRVPSDRPRKLHLDDAITYFKMAMSQELLDKWESIHHSVKANQAFHGLGKGIFDYLIGKLQEAPQDLLAIKGMNQTLLDELEAILRSQGHWAAYNNNKH